MSRFVSTGTNEKLGEHRENESFKQLCQSIRLALNSVLTRLKQKYASDLLTTDETMTKNIQEFEISLQQLTNSLIQN